jgi:hypothetical protein
MFLNAMSDIVVKRFNVHKEARDQIKTRIVYAPKQRVLNDLLDKDQNLQLPVISVNITNLTRDDNRVFNKLMGTYNTPQGSKYSYNERMPIPININYTVTVMTRYQEDTDQILSHLLPYVNPYFTVSWRTPKRPDFEIRSNVFWDGSVNTEYPTDLNATQVARIISTLTFTFQGWLFQSIADEPIGNIYTINSTFNNVVNIPTEYVLENRATISNEYTDVCLISAVPPQPKFIDPPAVKVGIEQQFNVYGGDGFQKILNVYLSGAPLNHLSSIQAPFSGYPQLSASNPNFFGVKLDKTKWSYDKISSMMFVMPSAATPGRVDLIIEGPYGYGKLTSSVRTNTFNPYDPSHPSYSTFVPYQFPYSAGIEVFSLLPAQYLTTISGERLKTIFGNSFIVPIS